MGLTLPPPQTATRVGWRHHVRIVKAVSSIAQAMIRSALRQPPGEGIPNKIFSFNSRHQQARISAHGDDVVTPAAKSGDDKQVLASLYKSLGTASRTIPSLTSGIPPTKILLLGWCIPSPYLISSPMSHRYTTYDLEHCQHAVRSIGPEPADMLPCRDGRIHLPPTETRERRGGQCSWSGLRSNVFAHVGP